MTSPSKIQLEQLGEKCIRHLENEYANLQNFVDICHEIQKTLGTGNQQANDELMARQKTLESQINQTGQSRDELRTAIASQLGISESEATIRQVQKLLPPAMSDRIAEFRQEIESKVESIRNLTSANNLLLQQTIDIFQRLVISLSGSEGQSQTYTASGQLRTRLASNHVVIENAQQ